MSQPQLYTAVHSQLASVASYKIPSTRERISIVDPGAAPSAISPMYKKTEKGGLGPVSVHRAGHRPAHPDSTYN